MKKLVSIALIFSMIITSVSVAFARTTLTDVENTPYQTAVENLVNKGVLSGYPDNTFKPTDSISRTESCVVIVKSMNPAQDQLNGAEKNKFTDIKDTYWGNPYINYGAQKGIISGYVDGTFQPNKNVTYYEMAAMLVNAMGIKESDLTGTWPDNYFNKATELGIFKDIVTTANGFDGNAAATRGNVALMTSPVIDKIIDANKPAVDENPTEPPKGDEPGKDNTEGTVSTGSLSDYSGRAYGIVTSVADVINPDGDKVQQLEFLFGKEVQYLITKKNNTFNASLLENYDGGIFCLKMSNGVVSEVSTDPSSLNAKYFKEYTGGNYIKVESIANYTITIKNGGDKTYTIYKDAKIYVAQKDGSTTDDYEAGSVRDIKAGSEVRLYSVTEDSFASGPIEIVIVK